MRIINIQLILSIVIAVAAHLYVDQQTTSSSFGSMVTAITQR